MVWRFLRRSSGVRPGDEEIDRAVGRAFGRVEGAPADTGREWSRLERAIAAHAAGRGARADAARLRPAGLRLALGAAAVAAAAVGTVLLLRLPGGPAATGSFSTSRGERLSVTLPDSSTVLLNHTSSLSFDPAGYAGERAVSLTGEAFFSVRRGEAPFTVRTAAGSVTVTGTKFNVRARGGGYEVGVTEGSVRAAVPLPAGDSAVAVRAGRVLRSAGGAGPLSVGPIDDLFYPAWTVRKLVFSGADLASVCEELSNTFDVEVTVADTALARTTISGVFEARDAGQVLSAIGAMTGRNYRYEDGSYILR